MGRLKRRAWPVSCNGDGMTPHAPRTLTAFALFPAALTVALLWALPLLATEMAADDPNANASFDSAATAQTVDCETLAIAAGRAEGLPEGLLPAIARVESGRGTDDGGRRAWAWTLNEGGDGSFYADKASAMEHLNAVVDAGTTNVDVGCMQLNYKWHHKAFPSLEVMMDPVANTAYAARFVKELSKQVGGFEEATKVYHSFDPEKGANYLEKVAAAQAELGPLPDTLPEMAPDSQMAALAPDTGVVKGILMVAGVPLFDLASAGEAAALISAEAGVTEPNSPTAGQDPALVYGPPAPEQRSAIYAIALAEPDIRGKIGPSPILQEAELAPGLRAQWADVEALRRVLGGPDTP
jgi:hypothetical protein